MRLQHMSFIDRRETDLGAPFEARSCGRCLAGATRADLQAAACHEHDEASSEVRDYMDHSGLLWRLRPHDS